MPPFQRTDSVPYPSIAAMTAKENARPIAPSMTRWSYDNDRGNSAAMAIEPSRMTGFGSARPTERIAVVPNGMIGVPCPPRTAPMLDTVNVWPCSRSGVILRVFAIDS